MSELCLGRDQSCPRKYAELSPEEAYMLKRQQDLKLYVYSCKDIEQAFFTNLQFNHINEREFLEGLVSLKLVRDERPRDSLEWQNFYHRLRVSEALQGLDQDHVLIDLKSAMIALYFLTSSKASVKAQYIGSLFYNQFSGKANITERGLDQGGAKAKLETRFLPSDSIRREL